MAAEATGATELGNFISVCVLLIQNNAKTVIQGVISNLREWELLVMKIHLGGRTVFVIFGGL